MIAAVPVHDIHDAAAFVAATINRLSLQLSPTEREDLTLEGIAILYELADAYEPHREGYPTEGRFSGYAARFLPGRVLRAWHKLHPEHRQETQPDGSTTWRYYDPAISLHRDDGTTLDVEDPKQHLNGRIYDAAMTLPSADRLVAAHLSVYMAHGHTIGEIVASLGISREEGARIACAIGSAINHPLAA